MSSYPIRTKSGEAYRQLRTKFCDGEFGPGERLTDTSPVLAIASTVRSDLVGKNRGGLHDCGEATEIMRPVCRHVRRCNSVGEICRPTKAIRHWLGRDITVLAGRSVVAQEG